MMKIAIDFKVKCFTKQELFITYKPAETYKGCRRCSNYSRNYSCPDLPYTTEEYLKDYNYVIFAIAEIHTESIQDYMQDWDVSDFPSRVLTNHFKRLSDKEVPLSSAVSMYLYNQIKDIMTERLLLIEADIDVLGLPPGSCTRCKDCLKELGKPCVHPDKIRHSIEALGFLVSDIYRLFFNKKLGWSKGKLSDIIHSCNVIFSKEKLDLDTIRPYLEDITLTLPEVEGRII
jgi:predicted metal-binding protein